MGRYTPKLTAKLLAAYGIQTSPSSPLLSPLGSAYPASRNISFSSFLFSFSSQYKVDGVGTDQLPLFTNGDTVSGSVKVAPQPGKKVEHLGVKVRGQPRSLTV